MGKEEQQIFHRREYLQTAYREMFHSASEEWQSKHYEKPFNGY